MFGCVNASPYFYRVYLKNVSSGKYFTRTATHSSRFVGTIKNWLYFKCKLDCEKTTDGYKTVNLYKTSAAAKTGFVVKQMMTIQHVNVLNS